MDYGLRETDNRNESDVSAYLEARVEVLRKRVKELEQENVTLTELLFQKWKRVCGEEVSK